MSTAICATCTVTSGENAPEGQGRSRFAEFESDLRTLKETWRRRGLYRGSVWYTGLDALIIVLLFVCGVGALSHSSLLAGICTGLAVHQCGRIAHELGHRAGLFSVEQWPSEESYTLSLLLANACLGFDGELWKMHHQLHHEYTMHRSDAQIKADYPPLLSHHAEVVKRTIRRPFGFLMRAQHLLWLPALLFVVKWIKFRADWCDVPQIPHRIFLRRAVLLGHLLVLAGCMASSMTPWLYFLGLGPMSGLLHLQLLFNHYETEHHDNPTKNDYAQQVLHTVNYKVRNPLEKWIHISLAHQIEHHLDPKLPSEHFTTVAPEIESLCLKHGLPYRVESFWAMIANYTMRLRRVANEASASVDAAQMYLDSTR